MFKLLLIGMLAAAAFFGYQKITEADKEDFPTPTQVVVPNPPNVDFSPPSPLK